MRITSEKIQCSKGTEDRCFEKGMKTWVSGARIDEQHRGENCDVSMVSPFNNPDVTVINYLKVLLEEQYVTPECERELSDIVARLTMFGSELLILKIVTEEEKRHL